MAETNPDLAKKYGKFKKEFDELYEALSKLKNKKYEKYLVKRGELFDKILEKIVDYGDPKNEIELQHLTRLAINPMWELRSQDLFLDFHKYACSHRPNNYSTSNLCSGIIQQAVDLAPKEDKRLIKEQCEEQKTAKVNAYIASFDSMTGIIDKTEKNEARQAYLADLSDTQKQVIYAYEHAREDNKLDNTSRVGKHDFSMVSPEEEVVTHTGIPKHEAVAFIKDLYQACRDPSKCQMSTDDLKLGANILHKYCDEKTELKIDSKGVDWGTPQHIKGLFDKLGINDDASLNKIAEEIGELSLTTNAHDWGSVSSNNRENSTYLKKDTGDIKVPLPKTVNRGSAGMTHEKDEDGKNAKQLGVYTPMRYMHGGILGTKILGAKNDPLIKGGYERAKKIIKADLEQLIDKEIKRVGGVKKLNLENIKYFEHRYLGGLADDNEPISEMAVHMALDDAKDELQSQYQGQSATGTLKNVIYNNTCLTTGKNILGTSVSSEIPNLVQKYLNTPDKYNDENFGEKWINAEAERLSQDPDFIKELLKVNEGSLPKDDKGTKNYIEKAAELRAKDSAQQIREAIKGLKNIGYSGLTSHTDHKSSQAAYVNIIMSNLGFNIVTGCKSSIDRAGGEYTTRTAFSKFIRKHEYAPSFENLQNATTEQKADLVKMYLETYHDITAEVGSANRGVKGTKTFMNFVAPEVKMVMKERSKSVQTSLGENYRTLRNAMGVLDDKVLIGLVNGIEPNDAKMKKCYNDIKSNLEQIRNKQIENREYPVCTPEELQNHIKNDIAVLAQDTMVLNYQARNKLTEENSNQGVQEFDPSYGLDERNPYLNKLSELHAKQDLYTSSYTDRFKNFLKNAPGLPIIREIARIAVCSAAIFVSSTPPGASVMGSAFALQFAVQFACNLFSLVCHTAMAPFTALQPIANFVVNKANFVRRTFGTEYNPANDINKVATDPNILHPPLTVERLNPDPSEVVNQFKGTNYPEAQEFKSALENGAELVRQKNLDATRYSITGRPSKSVNPDYKPNRGP